jgi:nitrile hydratase
VLHHVKSLESLLVEKGLVDPAAIDAIVDTFEHKVGPRNGARVVARAWVDPAYKQRLLEDATKAIAELGYSGFEGSHMVVVENTSKLHNLVVCTLCSVADARPSAGLVQIGGLSLSFGH